MHDAKRQAMRERPARMPRTIARERTVRPSRTIVWVAKPTHRIDPENAIDGRW